MNEQSLTVIVHTYNAATTLADCLRSVVDLADELIVMDMESTDQTLEIARKFNARILHHPNVGYADPARNKAIAAAKSDWILVLDADEEAPPGFAQLLPQLMSATDADAYAFPRKNLIFKQWAKTGWWPDHQIRLFRTGHLHWPPELHGTPQVKGTLKLLENEEEYAITHHNYPDIDSFVDRAQRYSTIAAQEMADGQRTAGKHLLETFLTEVIKRYYVEHGKQQKAYGLTLSTLQGFFELMALAKFWEKEQFTKPTSLPPLSEVLDQMAEDAFYWEMHEKWAKASGLTKLWWRVRMRFRI